MFFLLAISLISAGTSDDAKTCLTSKINEKTCSELSADEQIFSILAVSKCQDELVANSKQNQCWPLTNCNIKTTAQAVFALSTIKTEDAENWLLTQTKSPSELTWYLQIDTNNPSTCKIIYDGQTTSTNIDDNDKLSSNAGACLVKAYDDYWFEVEKNCYNKEISISCNEAFSTTLLYKKSTSSVIYLSGETQSASSDGTITETINSLCFEKNGICDYESTLWAVLALKSKNINTDSYIPYLTLMADENSKYLPDAFLYMLTGNTNYYDSLLLKQKTDYWEESGDKYYDSAVALLALQNDKSIEKTNTLTWLLSVQDKDGCWRGNIQETGFLLFSGWGSLSFSDIPSTEGIVEELSSCSELNGEICSSNENCDSTEQKSSDGWCCLGNCETTLSPSEPENPQTPSTSKKNYWYIWVLLGLIIFVIIGIIFRHQLRVWWFRFKSGFGNGSNTTTKSLPPRGPPSYTPRPIQRRITPPSGYPPKPRTEMEKEFSDVLKKLKEISS